MQFRRRSRKRTARLGGELFRLRRRAVGVRPAPFAILVLAVFSVALSGCSLLGSSTPSQYFHYTVQRGDTLYGISTRFNVKIDALEAFNDVDDPRELQVGQVLKIPYRGPHPPAGVGVPPSMHRMVKPDAASMRMVRLTNARRYVGALQMPVKSATISSLFGSRWGNFHEGIDLSAPKGTEVYAAISGQVVYSDDEIRGYGNMVIIKNGSLLTVYAHNSENVVRVGDEVSRGELIAYLGATGHVTGPHVHFETRIKTADGKFVAIDPMVFFNRV